MVTELDLDPSRGPWSGKSRVFVGLQSDKILEHIVVVSLSRKSSKIINKFTEIDLYKSYGSKRIDS